VIAFYGPHFNSSRAHTHGYTAAHRPSVVTSLWVLADDIITRTYIFDIHITVNGFDTGRWLDCPFGSSLRQSISYKGSTDTGVLDNHTYAGSRKAELQV